MTLGEGGVERLDGGRDHGLRPERRRGDAEPAGAPGMGGGHRFLTVPDLAQDAARVPDHQGAEPGRAHAGGNALEQAAAELPLQAGENAAQRRLGHREPVGGGDGPLRVGDGEQPDQIAAPFEHVSAPPCPDGLAADQTGVPHHAVSVSRAVPLRIPSVGYSPVATLVCAPSANMGTRGVGVQERLPIARIASPYGTGGSGGRGRRDASERGVGSGGRPPRRHGPAGMQILRSGIFNGAPEPLP